MEAEVGLDGTAGLALRHGEERIGKGLHEGVAV